MKYHEKLSRASSIIRKDKEEYCIMEFDHQTNEVALYPCNIEEEVRKTKEAGKYFINLTDQNMGHTGQIYESGCNKKNEWIWKPIRYICDFDVIFDW